MAIFSSPSAMDNLEYLPRTAAANGWVQMDEWGLLYVRLGRDGRQTGQIVRTSIGWVCDGLRHGMPINIVFPYTGSGWYEAAEALEREEGQSIRHSDSSRPALDYPGWIDFGAVPPEFPRQLGRIIGDLYLVISEILASSGPNYFLPTVDSRPVTDRRGKALLFRSLDDAIAAAEQEART